jgi:hypothetical protein
MSLIILPESDALNALASVSLDHDGGPAYPVAATLQRFALLLAAAFVSNAAAQVQSFQGLGIDRGPGWSIGATSWTPPTVDLSDASEREAEQMRGLEGRVIVVELSFPADVLQVLHGGTNHTDVFEAFANAVLVGLSDASTHQAQHLSVLGFHRSGDWTSHGDGTFTPPPYGGGFHHAVSDNVTDDAVSDGVVAPEGETDDDLALLSREYAPGVVLPADVRLHLALDRPTEILASQACQYALASLSIAYADHAWLDDSPEGSGLRDVCRTVIQFARSTRPPADLMREAFLRLDHDPASPEPAPVAPREAAVREEEEEDAPLPPLADDYIDVDDLNEGLDEAVEVEAAPKRQSAERDASTDEPTPEVVAVPTGGGMSDPSPGGFQAGV